MISDMNPELIVGSFKEARLKFFDGCCRKMLFTDMETAYPDGKLIVSTTVPDGLLTHVNRSFQEMSGYYEAELIVYSQTSRYVARAAFNKLRGTGPRGEKWKVIVKNPRKDGSFYWVKATVIPNIRHGKVVGYT